MTFDSIYNNQKFTILLLLIEEILLQPGLCQIQWQQKFTNLHL